MVEYSTVSLEKELIQDLGDALRDLGFANNAQMVRFVVQDFLMRQRQGVAARESALAGKLDAVSAKLDRLNDAVSILVAVR